jgi:hypothetical protein
MLTRILLVNFTKNETDKLKVPENVEIHRGYLSDIISHEKDYDEDYDKFLGKTFKAYFPLAIHEYKAIFVKLHTVPDLEKEFTDKIEPYNKKYVSDLINYILESKGYLVVLLGNYTSKSLLHLGIRDITLRQTATRDKTINVVNEEFNKVFGELESEVIMPTECYITIDNEENDFYKKFSSDFCIKNIYKNKAGDTLSCYHNNSMHYSNCNPVFFLLPLFRNNTLLIAKLLKEFAVLSPKFLPEFYEPDWQNSNKYFPLEVQKYEDKISKIVEKANSLIADVEAKKKSSIEKYQFITNLLTQKHDTLKESVVKVFENIFQLKVIDADKNKETTLNHEDAIVEVNGEKILVEIKGDNSSYPSTVHIAQLWKHLKNKKEIEKGALVLNYDVSTEPEKRKHAYTGEEEHQLDGITLIDTRVLHDLAIAVIDYNMAPKKASEILLQTGRIVFDLDEYINFISTEAQNAQATEIA